VAGTCSCETNGSFPFKAIIQPADGLGTVWDEMENGYEGVWTRRGTGDTWEGRWGGSYTALLTITRGTDGAIRVDRRGADNCVYKGSIASDGVTVAGTFECEINKGPYTFKAVVRW
jgi:hypothetical protein